MKVRHATLWRAFAPARWLGGGAAGAALLALWATVAAAPPDEAASICEAGGGALVANAGRLPSDVRLFQTSYTKAGWSGEVSAFAIDEDGTVQVTPVWRASERVPSAAQRLILTSTAPTTGTEFRWSAMPAALQARFGSEAMVNYLRGEGVEGFRNRESPLGAIVNSEVVFTGTEAFGYELLPGAEGASYPAFISTKPTRPALVLVGGNGGMLHAFDASTGVERFAYVPRALVEERRSEEDSRASLVRLSESDFSGRYFVDGSIWVGDAHWGNAWKTVAVATAGAGARSVFALNISEPNSMSTGKLLFDLSDVGGSTDPNLGYSFGQPVIGRLADGDFYAIFGNGRQSERQCPVLYLVRLRDGVVRRIPTGGRTLGASCAEAPNGLGRPSLYDVHRTGEAGYRVTDFVFAGDLQGNVWRFDLRSIDVSSEPPAGVSARLIFSARSESGQVQPITGAIELGPAPAAVSSSTRPVMLWFGTGRYFTASDASDASVQAMYGIVDRFSSGGDANVPAVPRTSLQRQTASSGVDGGTIAASAVDYVGGQNGWYLELRRSGERMTGVPLIQRGRLLFATFAPAPGACYRTGAAWIYAVDPYQGGPLALRAFIGRPGLDFFASSSGVVRDLASIDVGGRAFLYLGSSGGGTSGPTVETEEIRPVQPGGTRGRVSWREIVR